MTKIWLKAPKYDGTRDVEYFLERYLEITEANDWDQEAAFLHFRESLKGEASVDVLQNYRECLKN